MENENYLENILFVELQLLPLNPSHKHVRSMVPYRGNANPLQRNKHVNRKIHIVHVIVNIQFHNRKWKPRKISSLKVCVCTISS